MTRHVCLPSSLFYTSSIPFEVNLFLPVIFPHNRERRVENEVERVAELQGGRQLGVESEGATGGLAVVSVQSIESVKVRTYDSNMACKLGQALCPRDSNYFYRTIFHTLYSSIVLLLSISIPHCLRPSLPLFSLSRVESD